ncbi:MAG: EamA family transporter [Myxococcota bacterium]
MSGIVQLIAASLLWSVSFGLIKGHLGHLHPAFVGFARLALTLPVFLPFVRFRGLSPRDVLGLVALGGVQYGLAYSTYLYAYQYLEGHHVALLTIFTPFYVVAFDGLRTRRWAWRSLGLAGVAVAGAAVIQYRGVSWQGVAIGVALMQVANACFAWGQLRYRAVRHRHPTVRDRDVFGLLYLGAVLVTATTTTLLDGWGAVAQLDGQSVGVLLYLGIGASGLGFFLWNAGAVLTAAAPLAVLNNVKIPLAVVASVVVFGENTDLVRLGLGGGLMVLAAWAAQRTATKPDEDGPPQE